jgi:hypothetical protein
MSASDKKQIARIERIMVPWLKRFDLFNTWVTNVKLVKHACCGECRSDPSEPLACVTVGTPYKQILIEFNREKLARTPSNYVEHTLVHELVHVLLQPLMSECNLVAHEHDAKGIPMAVGPSPRLIHAHESVTDAVANLLLWDSKGQRLHGTTSGRS